MYWRALRVVFLRTALTLAFGSSTCFPAVEPKPPKPIKAIISASASSGGGGGASLGGGGGGGTSSRRAGGGGTEETPRPSPSTGSARVSRPRFATGAGLRLRLRLRARFHPRRSPFASTEAPALFRSAESARGGRLSGLPNSSTSPRRRFGSPPREGGDRSRPVYDRSKARSSKARSSPRMFGALLPRLRIESIDRKGVFFGETFRRASIAPRVTTAPAYFPAFDASPALVSASLLASSSFRSFSSSSRFLSKCFTQLGGQCFS
mmetsp:Transcript_3783/g.16043  ORF Transcript_3783/g.16043 Transcript_3783/m.16043 type:complete len:264 (-) Transcript_3783:170-961(-)